MLFFHSFFHSIILIFFSHNKILEIYKKIFFNLKIFRKLLPMNFSLRSFFFIFVFMIDKKSEKFFIIINDDFFEREKFFIDAKK